MVQSPMCLCGEHSIVEDLERHLFLFSAGMVGNIINFDSSQR
jgi:hypothetical protein